MQNPNERRRHQREDIRLSATAVMQDGLLRQDIMVVNLSKSGAMVELSSEIVLSDDFTLLFDNKLEECRLVWRSAQFAGVQFETTVE